MRSFFIALFLMIITGMTYAQSGLRDGTTKFSIGPTLGWSTHNPLKDVPGNKGWSLGAGGILQVEHFYGPNYSGVAQIGIESFAGRSAGSGVKNKGYTVIPLRAGLYGYMGDFHIGALIGIGFNSFQGSKTAFAYSPQIGYNFSRNAVPLDFTVSLDGYAGHGNFSAFMMKLALSF